MSSYPGGKAGAGVWQRLICEIPPVRTWISCFAGHCAVTRHLRPAQRTIVLDKDPEVIQWWRKYDHVDCVHGCGIEWLAERYGHLPDLETTNQASRYQVCETRDLSTFVYADPPYPAATRSKHRIYRYELSDDQHRQLLAVLLILPCNVMVHSRPNPVYACALSHWRTWTYEAMTRGGIATEQVWVNYPPPTELHDYRWIGANKREREKLARRCNNLLRKIRTLPEWERRQLLAAVADSFGDSTRCGR